MGVHTLVEADSAVVAAGDGAVWSLGSDGNGVHGLDGELSSLVHELVVGCLTLECPITDPTELPESNMKACPNLKQLLVTICM